MGIGGVRMQYIIKNCPAYRAGMNLPHYCKAVGCCINTYVDGMDCTTISNCLLKKIIQTTNQKRVLDLFDIELLEE